MPECPVCQQDCPDASDRCPTCGWDVTPASLATVAATHLDWARSRWQELQALQDRVVPTQRLSELERQSDWAAWERSQLRQQLDWMLRRIDELEATPTTTWDDDRTRLASAVDYDYAPLQTCLAEGDWRGADELTWAAVRAVARSLVPDADLEALFPEDIAQFPALDLETLDALWYDHSGGRFGFSVQLQVWHDSCEDYEDFCDRVGWRSLGNWAYYDSLNFNDRAAIGHLPVLSWRKRACYGAGSAMAAQSCAAWMARFAATRAVEDAVFDPESRDFES